MPDPLLKEKSTSQEMQQIKKKSKFEIPVLNQLEISVVL
jgi:hypothetical protein